MRARASPGLVATVGSTLVLQLLTAAFTMATAAVVARWLGPQGKGMLSLSLLTMSLLHLALGGGFSVANAYLAGSRRFDEATLAAASTVLALLGTGAGALLMALAAAAGWLEALLPGVPRGLLAGAVAMLPMSLLVSMFVGILQGRHRITAAAGVPLAQAAAACALTVLLVVVLRCGVVGALAAAAASGALGVAVAAVMLGPVSLRPRWEPAPLSAVLGFGLRSQLANLLQYFNYRLDVFVLNYFWGPMAVGLYGTAVALAEFLWYLPNAVGFVILPKAAGSPSDEMNRFTPGLFLMTLLLTALGAVLLAGGGRQVIGVIYSSAFLPAYPALLALLPGTVLLGAAKVLTNEIAGRGYPQYNAANAGLALVVTLTLDLFLIPRHGLLGAAIATSIAYAVSCAVAMYCYRIVTRRPARLRADPVAAT